MATFRGHTGNARKVTAESLDFAHLWLSLYEPDPESEGEEREKEIANLLAWLDREANKKEKRRK